MKYSEIKQKLGLNVLQETDDEAACFTHYIAAPAECSQFKASAADFLQARIANAQIDDYLNPQYDIPCPPPAAPEFTFIDLFAGIGGFRIAMQSLGGKCLFTSEIDRFAKKSYEVNFGEVPFGDIKKINEEELPDHDILCAGFPCQAFSIAGQRQGFKDETRGTLFFDIARILDAKRPRAFFLENVKGLTHHNGGKTLQTILRVLREDLDYFVPQPQIINAKDFGVPQNRERIFIVGFRKNLGIRDFDYPEPTGRKVRFTDVKEREPVSAKYYLSDVYVQTLENHRRRHAAKGNGFGYEIIADNQCANAIVVGGMGRERNIVIDHRLQDFTPVTNIKGAINRQGLRRMTPREWARLQGFPDTFTIAVSDTQAYKQFGNSVAIPAIRAVAEKITAKIS